MLFQLLSKLHESTCVVIINNLSFSEWETDFVDAKAPTALLDHLADRFTATIDCNRRT